MQLPTCDFIIGGGGLKKIKVGFIIGSKMEIPTFSPIKLWFWLNAR